MPLIDRIREANAHDLSAFSEWGLSEGAGDYLPVGFIRRDRVEEFRGLFDGFESDRSGRLLIAPTDLQAWLDGLGPHLVEREAVAPLSGEMFPVLSLVGAPPVGAVDRRLVAWLGIPATGVHVNVFQRQGSELRVWIARRALDKLVFPGLLDNAVAGGQPLGLGLAENVVKECGEEAGIPTALAVRAEPVGLVQYMFENDSGLKPDTLYCFDLELPNDFEPRPVDGEVESFQLVTLAELRDLVASGPVFKFNSALVCIDFLLRHAASVLDDAEVSGLAASLRQPLGS